jgi:proline iminopeptidase
MTRTLLYPPIEPFNTGRLRVSDLHELYYEQCGNPEGIPVVFLHGGPGGGCPAFYRQYFDPDRWCVTLFDQRGCGRSTPHAELRDNTTWTLIEDIETLRQMLGVDRWAVFGGSWGSTLALSYAIMHPDRCLGLILRGIFMLRRQELEWFYQSGASRIYPDAWEDYLAPIPADERGDLMAAYYKRLTSDDPEVRLTAARAWSIWEGSTSKLMVDPQAKANFGRDRFAEAFARIECHYFVNAGFFDRDDWILANAAKLTGIPGVIVQGRYDVVCPMQSAWDLHRAWPEAELIIVPDAGHSASEPGIRSALVEQTDRFATLLGKSSGQTHPPSDVD